MCECSSSLDWETLGASVAQAHHLGNEHVSGSQSLNKQCVGLCLLVHAKNPTTLLVKDIGRAAGPPKWNAAKRSRLNMLSLSPRATRARSQQVSSAEAEVAPSPQHFHYIVCGNEMKVDCNAS